MDIGKFIEEFDKAAAKDRATKKTTETERLIRKHITSYYISYEVKISEAKKIIQHSSYETIDGREYFRINSPVRYLLFMMSVIRSYTDLEFDTTNTMIQFDLLEQRGILDLITQVIGDDYDKFQTVLSMTLDDLISNERSLISKLSDLGDVLSVLLDQMGAATPTIDE